MLPLNSIIKDAFDKFDQDFQAANLPEGKYIKAPPSTAKWYKVGQPCYEDKIQELNTDFAKICISPKPPGAPMGKLPLPILKELEHQARQNISTLNFATTFAKTSSSCNSTLEKCQHSLKSTFKKVKSQIKKGADPEREAKHGYEEACEYLDLWNKTILIQHRALTCFSKTLAHILQRELYSMGNTGLLRREAEMTLLQPQLGETRRQELRNASFWPSSLFKSQLFKEGEDFLLKKGTSKDSQGFGPYQNKPFHGSHKKRGSYRKRPYGGNSSQSQTHSRVSKCDGRPPVQVEPSAVNRMVTASTGVQTDLPEVAHSSLDLFATHLNHKLPLYVSPIPDPGAWDIDALNINWTGLTAYAYPPMVLLHRVIQEIRQCHCLIIVIAPGWPGMPWFWDLVQLSTEIPLQLPVSTTLLKQSHKYVFHNNPQYLNLHAWCLGADNSKNKASLWRWQRELLPLSSH